MSGLSPFVPRAALLAALVAGAWAAPLAAQDADTLQLSLPAAVSMAQAGEEVTLAESRVDLASAQLGQARAAGLPQLRLNGGYTHVYENARAQAVGSIFNQPNTYTANLNLAVPLFQGGRVVQGLRAASRLRGAAEADLANTRTDVSLQTLQAYLSALLADQLVAIQENNLTLAEERLRQVEQFERAGRASRYDVLRARVERTNLEPLVIQARADRDLALLELRRLTNVPEGRPIRLVTRVDAATVRTLVDRFGARAAGSDSVVLDSLPAVRAARLRVEAQRAATRVARAGYLPSLSLSVGSGYQAFPSSAAPPISLGRLDRVSCPAGSAADRICTQQNGGWFSDRSLGLTVSWPLFDGLRTRSDVQLATAQARIASDVAEQTLEQARVEAARARAELRRTQALFDASRQNVAEAEEAFRIATVRFSRGLGTQLDVSDAQVALLTARTNEARATHELYLAGAALARALGEQIPFPAGAAPAPSPTEADARATRP
ncbi:MAG: TolC family protein [Gemmatimonadetes bacterium]|nr:TolC family protein [Gemmatimonadota bacterium]